MPEMPPRIFERDDVYRLIALGRLRTQREYINSTFHQGPRAAESRFHIFWNLVPVPLDTTRALPRHFGGVAFEMLLTTLF